ncbi:outer membrane receptor protein involved in Fe transport [Novosphingobium sp. SG751A]|uniref:TonB-dependent receptor plug domain-containing protein n=1 Tax=Novosphingobium sp. SG751A TaxID=2587000 RepID=UPI00155513A7|nr:TonB-dependent receptor [Novosphingobium sp. SG751A]NOW48054.1 outer membrane receptor protein involved in Fe transport [Novosphingobium sp. SG751A]
MAGSLVLGASAALAQSGDAASDAAIVVTGSRLGATGFSAPTPVTALGTEFIAARAPANIADVLNELPTFRDTSSPTQSQRTFGSGVNSVDLRGLGVVRTLVLVDGERFTPTAGTGVFDVGMIPAALVKRVDIITGGASAAYGSDAVAGVVNFVLDTKMTGLRGGVQMGISQQGDNKQPSANLVFGTTFADGRGHFVAAGEWVDSGGVGTLYSRDWGRQLPGLISYGTRAAGVPAQALATGVTYSAQTIGGLITSGPLAGTSFSPGGFQYGTVYGSLMTGGNNPLGQPFGNWPLATPVERKTGLTQISFEVSPSLELYAQGNYGKTDSSNFTSFNQSNFTISVNNPYLPSDIQQAMVARGLTTINVGRLLAETGGLRQSNQRETMRGVFGVKAHLWGWDWDASFQHGETHSTNVILQNVLTANYRAAVNAVRDANGNIVCGPTASNPNLTAAQIPLVQSGCVPINIFGQGSPSAAALAYIAEDSYTHTVFKRDLASINLRGSPFSTWAGPVKVAVGAERRRDSINVDVNDNSAQSLYSSGNSQGYNGSVVVTEEYAEIGVPLAKDLPLARSLDFNGAFRHTYYSTSGAVNTWKLGLVWEPNSDLRLRVTRSHDIRAPNLSELYSRTGRGVSFANGINTINGRTGAINGSSVGNLELVPEVAETLTAGVVLQPHGGFAQGLRLSLDAYSIKVKGVITTYNAQQVVNNCAAGNAAACAQITFDNTAFGIYNVATMPQNLSVLETRGLDVELSYPVPLPIPGKLLMRVLGTHVFKLATTDNAGTVDRAGTLQGNGMPSDTINGSLTYTNNGFTGNLNARYVSGSRIDATLYGPLDAGYNPAASNSININRMPAAIYFNLQVSQDVALASGRKVNLFAGVDNLLNTAPPVFAATTINSGGNPYDLIGRRFTFGARFSL